MPMMVSHSTIIGHHIHV